jgi:hypothetical protein
MGKGSNRRPQKVSDDAMAANWMDALGGEWEVKTLEGEVLHVADCYIKGRNWGLVHVPVGDCFSVVRIYADN